MALLFWEYWTLRHKKRGVLLTNAFAGILLVTVSLFPALVYMPAEFMSLGGMPGGRIMTLLVIATFFLLLLAFWERTKGKDLRERFNRLVFSQAVAAFKGDPSVSGGIWVVVPVFNEAENLRQLLPRIPSSIDGTPVVCLVADDGSVDGSGEVAKEAGGQVVSLPVNMGGGMALRVGFHLAVSRQACAVVTIDGDCQHKPEEIAEVVRPILAGESDLVIGSRFLGSYEHVSNMRSVGLHVFNAMINMLQGTRITDCASGFRAVSVDMLRRLTLRQEQYHTAEMIIMAAKAGGRITERPITVDNRAHGTSKKSRDIFYGLYFLRTVIKSWLK